MPLLLDLASEYLAAILETNLVGPFRLIKAITGPMALHGGGISSDAATSAYPGWGAYRVSKAALDHLLRTFSCKGRGFCPSCGGRPGWCRTTLSPQGGGWRR